MHLQQPLHCPNLLEAISLRHYHSHMMTPAVAVAVLPLLCRGSALVLPPLLAFPSRLPDVRQLLAKCNMHLDSAAAEPQWLRGAARRFDAKQWAKVIAAAQLLATRCALFNIQLARWKRTLDNSAAALVYLALARPETKQACEYTYAFLAVNGGYMGHVGGWIILCTKKGKHVVSSHGGVTLSMPRIAIPCVSTPLLRLPRPEGCCHRCRHFVAVACCLLGTPTLTPPDPTTTGSKHWTSCQGMPSWPRL